MGEWGVKLMIVCHILGLVFLAASPGESIAPPPPPAVTPTVPPATLEPKKTPELVKPRVYRVRLLLISNGYAFVP